MAIRWRKRVKIAPGVHLNLSRKGVTANIGVKGASVTVGRGKSSANLGIPGSGLSTRVYAKSHADQSQNNVVTTSGELPLPGPTKARRSGWNYFWFLLTFYLAALFVARFVERL